MFRPENALEEAMVAASRDASGTAAFLRALADAELYVPQEGPAPEREERRVARGGEEVPLPVVEWDGRQVVPVFTSMTQLLRYVPEGTPYVRITGRDVARMWPGDVWMALNPRGDVGTLLSPQQIRSLSGGQAAHPEGEYALGQPREEPRALLEMIELFCRRTPGVRAAYRAQILSPGERAQVAIGLELDQEADWEAVRRGAVEAARESGAVSFALVPVRRSDPGTVARYMLEQTRPFYRRDVA